MVGAVSNRSRNFSNSTHNLQHFKFLLDKFDHDFWHHLL